MMISANGYVAIIPPKNDKVEAKVEGGFAQAVQKREVMCCDLVMQYNIHGRDYVTPGAHQAIIAGEKAFASWSKKIYSIDGVSFVLCPVSDVIGFKEVE